LESNHLRWEKTASQCIHGCNFAEDEKDKSAEWMELKSVMIKFNR
jgi:hypothetical protein